MPQISVTSYGADPRGRQDSTAAFNEAIARAKEFDVFALSNELDVAISIYVPRGSYLVSSIDFCGLVAVELIGDSWQSGAIIYGTEQTTPLPILDCTASSSCRIRGLTFAGETPGGDATDVMPSCGILLGNRLDVPGTCTRMNISACGTLGRFSGAGLAAVGASEMVISDSCVFQNKRGDAHGVFISDRNTLGIVSAYEDIHPGPLPGKSNVMEPGTEVHGGQEVGLVP